MADIDEDYCDTHDGTSDAMPGGYADARRPGEALFALCLVLPSAFLFWNAYGISGFDALSGAGAVPMATTAVMTVCATLVAWRTLRLARAEGETLRHDIFPPRVALFIALLAGYALLLRPLGFLPTSALFLVTAIKMLSHRGWGFSLVVALGSLAAIWLLFRIVFTVLMPAGIVPEAEIIQVFRNLLHGAGG